MSDDSVSYGTGEEVSDVQSPATIPLNGTTLELFRQMQFATQRFNDRASGILHGMGVGEGAAYFPRVICESPLAAILVRADSEEAAGIRSS